MLVERTLVLLYFAACIGIGIAASRRVRGSGDEYWVAGRRVGTWVNATAILAPLASGGSIIGVMGLAYSQGIPATLALFAGAVVGFPLASLLVARELRNFGRYTITDFLAFRYPSRIVRTLVPILIVTAFTIYIVAQLKAAGITARAPHGGRRSLNLAMLAYSALILAAVFLIVPVGKLEFPDLADADQVFLKVMQCKFPAAVRGMAVAAVLAAVMSTTDALLLACSSSISHDLLGNVLREKASQRTIDAVRVGTAWGIGLLALYWAYSPPELISQFYTAGVGLLSGSLFVPVIAGLWWKKANRIGGVLRLVPGALPYGVVHS